ncbi:magnesium-transporting ATPase [endosymbiont 'TC1' of Trimyema compressum]|uniref:calcium-translocating P-type ATPase, PMCA-type n=1 Tax=endosymbiont 'TC1' of Trimyema compressum TaxID=243899 RepID=UPI0007F128EF|nr:magnesium-transporting ATPase [endosymbiont 'TC1' of Trimyema compressum]
MKAFKESSRETLERLNSNLSAGLSDDEVAKSKEIYGENSFTKGKTKSLLQRTWDAAKEPMIILLIIAALITFVVNLIHFLQTGIADFIECISIVAAVAISVIITVAMEGRSAKAFDALNKIKEDIDVKIIRNGQILLIPQNEIVVGDIVELETGNKIPADGRMLESVGLTVDESALTGESHHVEKQVDVVFEDDKTPLAERVNMLYSGCFITGGRGKIIVTEVGDQTEFGLIARELSGDETWTTPLQEKLARLGKIITIFGATAAALVFIFQVVIAVMNGNATFEIISQAFITSIVFIVTAVPEGLPTIVAISLALNIIKMSKENALVKKLVACETIGSINVICSDKTGTLTENRMTVTGVFIDGKIIKPEDLNLNRLAYNMLVNSTADVDYRGESPKFIGNPTECAMLVAYGKGKDTTDSYETVREDAEIAHSYSFSSETKNMTTVVRDGNEYDAYSKGSPEKILAQCTHILINDKVKPLTDDIRKEIEDAIIGFQEKANRVLAFAHKEFSEVLDFESSRSIIESEMIYDGFVAITDPVRSDVYEAVIRCRNAGIDLKMLTGDNIVTARAIADDLGILDDDHMVVEGKDVEDLTDEELKSRIPLIRVIARSTPVIKMRVVNALKELGHVVAVTGDGINDAPAIKNADVGIAMGISGTEVSKEASDIVLLDDAFSIIVKAVQWGRGIYENFQRFIQFQLTVNLSAVIVIIASLFAGMGAPFSALQILWINLIMDGPPAVTLGLEPIREDLMKRKPISRKANIVTKSMLGRIIVNGLFISVIFMIQNFFNIIGGVAEQQGTILFTLFVAFQLFNAFNSRELSNTSIFKNLLKNRMMVIVFVFTFALQIFIVQVGGAVFKTVPLSLDIWLKIIGVAFTVVLASELIKLIKRIFVKNN